MGDVLVNDIKQICSPLFKNTPIECFSYGRFYDDGSFFMLTDNDCWLEHYYKNGYKLSPPISHTILRKKFYYIPICDERYAPMLYDSRNLFHHDHFIAIIEIAQGYYEQFSFGSVPNNISVFNFYLNNMNQLENYTHIIRDKAEKLINKVKKHSIILPSNIRPSFTSNDFLLTKRDECQLFANTLNNIANFNVKGSNVMLSKRENECLIYLSRGYSSKNIARKLGDVSYRTVEKHIEHIKEKLGCHYKADLTEYVWYNYLA
jgi:DNA-binding CsgD family transcriptional regulator